MGCCCSVSEDDEERNLHSRGAPSDQSGLQDSERTPGVGSLMGSIRKTSIELVAGAGLMGGPKIHKARSSVIRRASERSYSDNTKLTLAEATDEQLLTEVLRRKINLHERVTKDLVEQKYAFGKLLGQGASGSVFEATHRRTGIHVAVKVIKSDGEMNDDTSMATELEILRTVRHRYLLNCHELYESPQCIWVVMELIKGGELLDTLIDTGVYDEAHASRALKQVLMAVRYLHSQGVVHRDLKLQNLLLTEKNPDLADTKVADFGLSAVIPTGSDFDPSDREAMKRYNKLRDRWGTPHYFAPEMVRKAYGPQVDIWALGVVLYQLLVGRLPFNASSTNAIFEQIQDANNRLDRLMRQPEWAQVSEAAKDFLRNLLEPDPMKRFSAEQALNHPWIVLRGGNKEDGSGSLTGAYILLKQQLAQRRIADMWHVLDIMNALESSGAASSGPAVKKLHPSLIKKVSEQTLGGVDKLNRRRQSSKTDMVQQLESVFDLFDRDGDGTVDTDELSALMTKLGFTPNEQKLKQVVAEVDVNKNGKLEFEEFCEFLKVARKNLGIGTAMEREIGSLGDEDGFVSSEDIRGMVSAFGDHLGQSVSDEEINIIIALSEAEDGRAKTDNVVKNLLLPQQERQAMYLQHRSRQSSAGPSSTV